MDLDFSIQDQVRYYSKKEGYHDVKCHYQGNKISYIKKCNRSYWMFLKNLSNGEVDIVFSSDNPISRYYWINKDTLLIEQDKEDQENIYITILDITTLREYKINRYYRAEFLDYFFAYKRQIAILKEEALREGEKVNSMMTIKDFKEMRKERYRKKVERDKKLREGLEEKSKKISLIEEEVEEFEEKIRDKFFISLENVEVANV